MSSRLVRTGGQKLPGLEDIMEEKKKSVELKIATALRDTDFEKARTLSEELEEIVKSM